MLHLSLMLLLLLTLARATGGRGVLRRGLRALSLLNVMDPPAVLPFLLFFFFTLWLF